MDKNKMLAASIDYEKGLKQFAGKEAIYVKYLNKFGEDIHYEQAVKAMENKDYDEVLKALHALKGIAGTLGMMKLFDVCTNIVNAIRENDYDRVTILFDDIKKAYELSLEASKSN